MQTPYLIKHNLKILRYEHNLSQPQFAKSIGVGVRTLRRWEAGQRTPCMEHLKRIIDRYHIEDLYQFMYGPRPLTEIPKLNWI